jgi:hypothetical protein
MKASTHINPENGSACPCFGKGYISDSLISPVMPQDLTNQIIGEMDQGVMIGNTGHGSMQHSAHGNIVFTDDIPHLSSGQRLPVMVILTCLNGCFAKPNGSRSLAEETLLSDGAVAAFASTRLTRAQVQKLLDQGLVEATFQKMVTRLD